MKRSVNSSISTDDSMSFKLLIQWLLWSSVHTDLILYRVTRYKLGANSLGEVPFSHLASQNGAFLPSPIVTVVEQKNKFLSILSVILRRCLQGLSV
jgi:hypothetical protein